MPLPPCPTAEPHLTRSQQLKLLLWQLLVTDLCPQCRYQFESGSDRVFWDCPKCGWRSCSRANALNLAS
ncbi:MAG: hypothetical protein HC895_13920 [Leptolyngbyaceae cyanobacterium SM1_3_5]|nr:hypothetical protein [Leptolyngbyaceae cyanobacterium SM1_3_5]